MAALIKSAISVTGKDRAKWTKIWDHKSDKSQLTNILKIPNVIKKIKMAALAKNAMLVTVRESETDEHLGSQG